MPTVDHGKSQNVRLIDVFVLGPFMIWMATRGRRLTKAERWGLAAMGAATITYNWRNYSRIERLS